MDDQLETAHALVNALPLPEGAAAEPAGLAGYLEQTRELLAAGGPVVLVLLAFSVAALAIVFVKLLQFRAARLGDRRRVREVIALHASGRPREALKLAEVSRNPIAQMMARALRGQLRNLPEHKVREEAFRYGSEALEDLKSWLRPLEVIASLAPLLGLFGTVLGMISAFQQLEAAGSRVNPSVLSGGIWEALLTTAVGLAVAIPAVIVLNWLERRVERLAHEMDSALARLFTPDLSESIERELHERAGLRVAAAAAGE